ncbi:MAG: hypothetical protein FWC03_06550 [Treponema sp.]|nr:hypothetical protein [Treponema sp.]
MAGIHPISDKNNTLTAGNKTVKINWGLRASEAGNRGFGVEKHLKLGLFQNFRTADSHFWNSSLGCNGKSGREPRTANREPRTYSSMVRWFDGSMVRLGRFLRDCSETNQVLKQPQLFSFSKFRIKDGNGSIIRRTGSSPDQKPARILYCPVGVKSAL